jgi:hypothetical protein
MDDPGCDAPSDGEWHCHDACEAPPEDAPVAEPVTAPAGLELASNYHQTRAHYSDNLSTERAHYVGGRAGEALCSTLNNYLDVYDDAEHEGMAKSWNSAHRPKPVASLPLCKRCERKAAHMAAAS